MNDTSGMPTRASSSATSRSAKALSQSRNRRNPCALRRARHRPGAIPAAIVAASTTNVPEPHIGSSNGSPVDGASRDPGRHQPAIARMPAASTSESGASTSPIRQPRWWSDRPAASRKIVATSPTRCSPSRSVAPRNCTLGRLPLGVRSWSTTASFTTWAANSECVVNVSWIAASTRIVSDTLNCSVQSTSWSARYSDSGESTRNRPSGSRIRIAVRLSSTAR